MLLRDDDTNFFTEPAVLERLYGDLWANGPVTLAVIPYVRGGRHPYLPEQARHAARAYPLGDNRDLVGFLREHIAAGHLHVALHGCTHEDLGGRPEFVGGRDVADRIRRGREHLEDVLGVRIMTFVPPHNRLSLQGYRAVRSEGLNLLNLPAVRGVSRPLSWPVARTIIARLWYHVFWRCEYPRLVCFDGHWGLGCTPLTPRTDLRRLARARALCWRHGWVLAVATHYWEGGAPLDDRTVHDVVRELLLAGEGEAPISLVSPAAVFSQAGRHHNGG